MAQLRDTMDSSRIRQVLGSPDSITITESPFGGGGSIAKWYYRQVVVAASERVIGLTLLGPRLGTSRGLRIGDPERRVIALYGPPSDSSSGEWWYPDPRDPNHERVLLVSVEYGVVSSIYVGLFVD